jgi:hypothetical protein
MSDRADQTRCDHPGRTSAPQIFNLGAGVRLVGDVLRCPSCGRATVLVPRPDGTPVGSNVWRRLDRGDGGEADLMQLAALAVKVRAVGMDRAGRDAMALKDLAAVREAERRGY